MKKLLLSLLLAGTSVLAFAQLPTFGIKGGVNFAKLTVSPSAADITVSTGSLTSFSVGAFIDFKFGNLSLQPAISYTGKGGQVTDNEQLQDAPSSSSAKIKLYYVQIPVNVVYHVPVVIGNVYFGAGPYVGVGVSGKSTIRSGNNTVSDDIHFGNDEGDVKSTDIGADFIAGFQFKTGLLIGVNYDLGLSNISNDSGSKTKNRVFGISVGYAF